MPASNLIPSSINGYELGKCNFGEFVGVVPEYTVNQIVNPSFEHDTPAYGYGTITGDGLMDTGLGTNPYSGVTCYFIGQSPIVNNSYFYYSHLADESLVHLFSLYAKTYRNPAPAQSQNYLRELDAYIEVRDNQGAILGQRKFRVTPNYTRLWVSAPMRQGAVYWLCLHIAPILGYDLGKGIPYIETDCWQLEKTKWLTSYCDGDQLGLSLLNTEYVWSGTHHQSTSYRRFYSQAGGREYAFRDFDFLLKDVSGLGMATMENNVNAIATGGSYFQHAHPQQRDFVLTGSVFGRKIQRLWDNLRNLNILSNHTRIRRDTSILLKYVTPDKRVIHIPAFYTGGLTGQTDNPYQENVAMAFTQFQPLLEEANVTHLGLYDYKGAYVPPDDTRDNIFIRVDGTWTGIGRYSGGTVLRIRTDQYYSAAVGANTIFVMGSFTAINGDSDLGKLAMYNSSTGQWSPVYAPVPTGTTDVYDIVYTHTLYQIYIGGNLKDLAGNSCGILHCNWGVPGQEWENMTLYDPTGAPDGSVSAFAQTRHETWLDGEVVYMIGNFTHIGGQETNGFGRWADSESLGGAFEYVGSAVSEPYPYEGLSSGTPNAVYFTTLTEAGSTALYRYNPLEAIPFDLDAQFVGTVSSLVRDSTYNVWAAGGFNEVNSIEAHKFAMRDGSAWDAATPSIIGAAYPQHLADHITTNVAISGNFTTVEAVPVNYGLAEFYSGAWHDAGSITGLDPADQATCLSYDDTSGALIAAFALSPYQAPEPTYPNGLPVYYEGTERTAPVLVVRCTLDGIAITVSKITDTYGTELSFTPVEIPAGGRLIIDFTGRKVHMSLSQMTPTTLDATLTAPVPRFWVVPGKNIFTATSTTQYTTVDVFVKNRYAGIEDIE